MPQSRVSRGHQLAQHLRMRTHPRARSRTARPASCATEWMKSDATTGCPGVRPNCAKALLRFWMSDLSTIPQPRSAYAIAPRDGVQAAPAPPRRFPSGLESDNGRAVGPLGP